MYFWNLNFTLLFDGVVDDIYSHAEPSAVETFDEKAISFCDLSSGPDEIPDSPDGFKHSKRREEIQFRKGQGNLPHSSVEEHRALENRKRWEGTVDRSHVGRKDVFHEPARSIAQLNN